MKAKVDKRVVNAEMFMMQVRVPVALHRALRHTAIERGTTVAALVAAFCAKSLGIKLESPR